jgi:hypothetical protein
MDVGDPGEAAGQPRPHLRAPRVATAPGVRAARGFEHAVLREEVHDGIEVVAIERVEELLEQIDRHRRRGHRPLLHRRQHIGRGRIAMPRF